MAASRIIYMKYGVERCILIIAGIDMWRCVFVYTKQVACGCFVVIQTRILYAVVFTEWRQK